MYSSWLSVLKLIEHLSRINYCNNSPQFLSTSVIYQDLCYGYYSFYGGQEQTVLSFHTCRSSIFFRGVTQSAQHKYPTNPWMVSYNFTGNILTENDSRKWRQNYFPIKEKYYWNENCRSNSKLSKTLFLSFTCYRCFGTNWADFFPMLIPLRMK